MARQHLNIRDFDSRFSMDERGRLFWDDQVIETRGLRTRDFVLAVIVAVAACAGAIATWVNVFKPSLPVAVTVTYPPPTTSGAAPAVSSPTGAELSTFLIGTVGPFAGCEANLPQDYQAEIDMLTQNYHDRLTANGQAVLVILLGAFDNRRLAPNCSARFGSNERLAMLRAKRVQEKFVEKLSRQSKRTPSFALFAVGPKHFEATSGGEERTQDRSVTAWVVMDSHHGVTAQKP